MSERFFTTSLLASIEKNFSYLALSSHMPVQKTVAHPEQEGVCVIFCREVFSREKTC
jgi:hypothetical protein